jgi:hypothetical protein
MRKRLPLKVNSIGVANPPAPSARTSGDGVLQGGAISGTDIGTAYFLAMWTGYQKIFEQMFEN